MLRVGMDREHMTVVYGECPMDRQYVFTPGQQPGKVMHVCRRIRNILQSELYLIKAPRRSVLGGNYLR